MFISTVSERHIHHVLKRMVSGLQSQIQKIPPTHFFLISLRIYLKYIYTWSIYFQERTLILSMIYKERQIAFLGIFFPSEDT